MTNETFQSLAFFKASFQFSRRTCYHESSRWGHIKRKPEQIITEGTNFDFNFRSIHFNFEAAGFVLFSNTWILRHLQGLLHLAKRELFKLSKQFSVIEMTQINIILAPCNSTIDVTLLAFSLWIDGHKIFLSQASRVSCKATSSHFALPFFSQSLVVLLSAQVVKCLVLLSQGHRGYWPLMK